MTDTQAYVVIEMVERARLLLYLEDEWSRYGLRVARSAHDERCIALYRDEITVAEALA